MRESFKITSVSRADFEARGYDTSDVTDDQMIRIASKMADVYVENMFWEGVDFHGDDMNMPPFKA